VAGAPQLSVLATDVGRREKVHELQAEGHDCNAGGVASHDRRGGFRLSGDGQRTKRRPTASLVPGPIDKAIGTVRNTESDVHNKLSELSKIR